jgi:CHAD domain-containing protein
VALLETWHRRRLVPDAGSDDAGQDIDKAVRKPARKAAKKAERRLAEACADGADTELHRARKAAKRARYAAEVLARAGGGKKGRKRFKQVQHVLGEHQDAVVAQAALRRIVSGIPAGESGFTLGLLHERERQRAEELHARACELAAS